MAAALSLMDKPDGFLAPYFTYAPSLRQKHMKCIIAKKIHLKTVYHYMVHVLQIYKMYIYIYMY